MGIKQWMSTMNQRMRYILMTRLQMTGSPSSSGESSWMRFNLAAALPKHAPPKPTRRRCPKAPNWEEVAVPEQRCEICRRSPGKDDLGRNQIGNNPFLEGLCGHTLYVSRRGRNVASQAFVENLYGRFSGYIIFTTTMGSKGIRVKCCLLSWMINTCVM